MHSFKKIFNSTNNIIFIILFSSLILLPKIIHATDAFDYSVNVAGGGLVVQGEALHLQFQTFVISGTVPALDYGQLSISGLPTGASINFPYQLKAPGCCGTFPYLWSIGNADGYSLFNLETTTNTALGVYPILFSMTPVASGPTRTYTYNLTVISPSALKMNTQTFPKATPIPKLGLWEENMKTFGNFFCDPAYITPFQDQNSWFYDGERVYYQIADYTHDPKTWNKCAQAEGAGYQASILANPSTFATRGYYYFSKGLRLNYERTGDKDSKNAVNILAANDSYGIWPTSAGDTTDSFLMRETAYSLQNLIDSEKIGHTKYPQTKTIMELLLGQLDQVYISKTYTDYEPFMVGLATESLIQYYNEVSPDPRIPYILKKTLDGVWENDWDPINHQIKYECFAPGAPEGDKKYNVFTGGAITQNKSCVDSLGDENLNLFLTPAYAWMFLKTGDPVYRDRGDIMFADGIKYNGLWKNYGEGGKRFTQSYRSTFDYVKYRKQANLLAPKISRVDKDSPTVSVVFPTKDAAASHTMTLIANAFDNVAVVGVQFKIDGKNAGTAVLEAPYETGVSTYSTGGSIYNNDHQIATYLLSNGIHTVTATAYDTSGNYAVSEPVTFTINNPINKAFAECPSTNIPTNSFQGCYYNHGAINNKEMYFNERGDDTNVPLEVNIGTLVNIVKSPTVQFNWDYIQKSRPPEPIDPNFFAVIWQGNFTLKAGNYKFNISKDKLTSERLYVDGQLISNFWNDPSSPLSTTVNFLTPATHLIRLEFAHSYFNAGDAATDNINLSWIKNK